MRASDFLPGEIIFQENNTANVKSTNDLSVLLKAGDYLIYENDAERKVASLVENVSINSFQIAPSSSINILNPGTRRKSYLGSTPDNVGDVSFDIRNLEIVESKEMRGPALKKKLPGYFIGNVNEAKTLTTDQDRRETLANGTTIYVENSKYIVQSVSHDKVTINMDFQSSKDVKHEAYVEYNTGNAYITVNRHGGISGNIGIQILSCDGMSDDPSDCKDIKPSIYSARSTRRYGKNSLILNGYIDKSTLSKSALKIVSDVPWHLYPGDVVHIEGFLYSVCEPIANTKGGNYCVLNSTHFSLAQLSNSTQEDKFRSELFDNTNHVRMQKLTEILPGKFLHEYQNENIVYFTEDLRNRLDTRTLIKIGDRIYSNYSISSHSPLGSFDETKFDVLSNSPYITTSRDMRPGHMQRFVCVGNGGQFRLYFGGFWSEPLMWNSTILTMLNALTKLPGILIVKNIDSEPNRTLCTSGVDASADARSFYIHLSKLSREYREVAPLIRFDTNNLYFNSVRGGGYISIDRGLCLQRSDFIWIYDLNIESRKKWNRVFKIHPTRPYNATHIPIVKAIEQGSCIRCLGRRVGFITLPGNKSSSTRVSGSNQSCATGNNISNGTTGNNTSNGTSTCKNDENDEHIRKELLAFTFKDSTLLRGTAEAWDGSSHIYAQS